jgi:hypothetical protein
MTESLYVYQGYTGIWRHIDCNDLAGLSVHPGLHAYINETQRNVTPLFLACLRKNYSIVSFLLQNGADPNVYCRDVTPLYLCCLYAGVKAELTLPFLLFSFFFEIGSINSKKNP